MNRFSLSSSGKAPFLPQETPALDNRFPYFFNPEEDKSKVTNHGQITFFRATTGGLNKAQDLEQQFLKQAQLMKKKWQQEIDAAGLNTHNTPYVFRRALSSVKDSRKSSSIVPLVVLEQLPSELSSDATITSYLSLDPQYKQLLAVGVPTCRTVEDPRRRGNVCQCLSRTKKTRHIKTLDWMYLELAKQLKEVNEARVTAAEAAKEDAKGKLALKEKLAAEASAKVALFG